MTRATRLAVLDMIAGLAVTALVLWLAVFFHVVTFDHYGGAYGVSVGTDTHYCSIETAWPMVTCESAS